MLASIYSMSPPEGGIWDSVCGASDVLMCVHMPDGLTIQVPVRRDQTAADLLCAACKVGFQTDISLLWENSISDGYNSNKCPTGAVMSFGFSCLLTSGHMWVQNVNIKPDLIVK